MTWDQLRRATAIWESREDPSELNRKAFGSSQNFLVSSVSRKTAWQDRARISVLRRRCRVILLRVRLLSHVSTQGSHLVVCTSQLGAKSVARFTEGH